MRNERGAFPCAVDALSQFQQVLGAFLYAGSAKLHLNRAPAAVIEDNHRIGLKAGLISIMVNGASHSGRVHTQIANAEGLEEEPEGVEIGKQRARGCS